LRAAARERGMKLAICTASTPENMALAFERFGLDAHVDTVVSPADGLRGKPHPDIFLEAARRLGVPAADCIVFEDAPLGIEAARRAGMPAVALTTSLPAQDFESFGNVLAIVPDLTTIDLAALEQGAADKKETFHA
jgi:beta-phosphoglucomutase-like phosphatase (HAD superfamily)